MVVASPVSKRIPPSHFDWKLVRADWQQLAILHAGTPEGVRFAQLLYQLRDWDGVLIKPTTFSLRLDA